MHDSIEHSPTPHHIVPVRTLLMVFGTLIALTVLTVVAAEFPTGDWEAIVAMGIATVKAGLVASVFMHLKYDNAFHGLLLVLSILFVALFLGLTLLDGPQVTDAAAAVPTPVHRA